MNHLCKYWLSLLALAFVVFSGPAQGQQGAARRPYVPVGPSGDIEEILRLNLEQVGVRDAMQNFLEEMLKNRDLMNDPLFKNLKNSGKFDLNDPKNQAIVKWGINQLEKNPGLVQKITEKNPGLTKEKLKEFAEKAKKEFGGEKADTGNEGPPPGKEGVPEIRQDQIPPLMGRPGQNNRPWNPDRGADMAQTARNWWEKFQDSRVFEFMWNKSDGFRGMANDFTANFLRQEGGPSVDPAEFVDRFGKWADVANRGGSFFDRSFSGFQNLRLPSLPSIRLPSISLGGLPAPSFGGGGGGAGGGEGLAKAVVWIALALVIGLILWQVFARINLNAAANQKQGWRLGSWPVHPAWVATREDLVLAFEFLALLLLGPASRSWNHREIAASMGGQADLPGKQAMADRLAALYEEARYAPDQGPLTGEALAEARRNLCYLGGVAAA